MRLSGFLCCTALMTVNFMNVKAAPPFSDISGGYDPWAYVTGPAAPLPRVPSPLLAQDKVLGEAYHDTLGILSEENSCSAFFGGPGGSVMVFNRFMSQVRKDYLADSIGMRMSGEITAGFDLVTWTRYRLFNRVSVNANGPFYRKNISPAEANSPRLAGYEPNTKQVRVLILLHELGHLMKGDDGKWLLLDDGKAESISHDNSEKIDEVCGEQIKTLTRASTR